MSRDFASFMASIQGDSAEEKIKELMEILDKVMQIIMNSTDQLFGQMIKLDTDLNALTGRLTQLESRPSVGAAPGQPMPSAGAPGTPAAPAPKPAPKPISPVSARAALQGELKALFARRKQE